MPKVNILNVLLIYTVIRNLKYGFPTQLHHSHRGEHPSHSFTLFLED